MKVSRILINGPSPTSRLGLETPLAGSEESGVLTKASAVTGDRLEIYYGTQSAGARPEIYKGMIQTHTVKQEGEAILSSER